MKRSIFEFEARAIEERAGLALLRMPATESARLDQLRGATIAAIEAGDADRAAAGALAYGAALAEACRKRWGLSALYRDADDVLRAMGAEASAHDVLNALKASGRVTRWNQFSVRWHDQGEVRQTSRKSFENGLTARRRAIRAESLTTRETVSPDAVQSVIDPMEKAA